MSRHQAAHLFALVALALAPVAAQGRTLSYNPKHVPPGELQSALGTRDAGGRATIDWMIAGVGHLVEVRRNDPANLLLFSGDDAAVDGVVAAEEQRSEEHTFELQSHSFISYAVFCS